MTNTNQNECSVEQTKRHAERLQFSQLIADNPNHFGNFAEIKLPPVDPYSNDTAFEELTYVGYNPDLGMLEAVVQIKQPSGYLGDNSTAGSYEYVRFYVDTGSGFQHAGMVAINVHDLPDGKDGVKHPAKPLSYAASVPYSPPSCADCDDPVLPLVRAILSWQSIPSDPAFPVAWGNSLDCRIPLKPHAATVFDVIENLLEDGALDVKAHEKAATVPSLPLPSPEPAPLTLAQLADLYNGMENQVPTHRFGYVEVHSALSAPSVSSELVANKMAEFAALKIDWSKMVGALMEKDADASFEQLDCVGLEGTPGSERLVATFRIKQTAGYSGNLCSAGSFEYVAFWADWDNMCAFTYLGTVPVKVHDINRAAGEDLCYMAVLPVDLSEHRAKSDAPKIARIRAVLSWAIPPSTTNPNTQNFWGNSIDTLVCFPMEKTGRPGGMMTLPSTLSKMFPGSMPAIAAALRERAPAKIQRAPNPASSPRSALPPAIFC
jgi:hypothetical protein